MSSSEEKNRLRLTPPQIIFAVAMVGIIALLAYNARIRYGPTHRCDLIPNLTEKAGCCNKINTRPRCHKSKHCKFRDGLCKSTFGYNTHQYISLRSL